MRDDWEDVSGAEAMEYFFHDVVGTTSLNEDQKPSRIVPWNVFFLALTWALVGLCISFGIEWTGRMAYITMGLPIVMLLILLIRSMTLPGASIGVKEYVGTWDLSILVAKPEIWSTAVSQIFFSIGVAVSSASTSHFEFRLYSIATVPCFDLVWDHDSFWVVLRA